MHEASIAAGILELVRQHVPAEDARRVRAVRVRIGDMAGVVPESLEFCFDAIIAGTDLGFAFLEIDRIPAHGVCGECGSAAAIDSLPRCPAFVRQPFHHRDVRRRPLGRGRRDRRCDRRTVMSVVTIERKVLEKNDSLAADQPRAFRRTGLLALNIVSSPGAGKTTLLEATIEHLRDRVRSPSSRATSRPTSMRSGWRKYGVPVVQIVTNGGCHLEAGLVAQAIDRSISMRWTCC
jgi:Zn finger protein HypA/HybF involved in hydrogenase expression